MTLNLSRTMFALSLLVLTGCLSSSSPGMRVITLVPSTTSSAPLHPFASEWFHVGAGDIEPSHFLNTTCLQPRIFGVTHAPNGGDQINRFPLQMRMTTIAGPTTYNSNAQMIYHLQNSTTLDAPIRVEVPVGQSYDVGIIGTLYNPVDENNDGICDETNVASGFIHSYQAIGHIVVPADNRSATYPLNVWVQNSSGSNSPIYCGSGPSNTNQLCPADDFYRIEVSGSPFSSSGSYIEFEFAYAPSESRRYLTKIYSSTPNFGNSIYLPSLNPLHIRYVNSSNVAVDLDMINEPSTGFPVVLGPFTIHKAL